MVASRIAVCIGVWSIGWSTAAAQYQPEVFAGPAVGRIHSGVGNATVAGLNLGIGIGIGGQSVLVGPEVFLLSSTSRRVRAFDLAVRLRQRVGALHPHLVASFGAYAWQAKPILTLPELSVMGAAEWLETDDFAGSVGVGVTVGGLAKRLSGMIEARWHRSLTETTAGSRSLLALSAGLRLTW